MDLIQSLFLPSPSSAARQPAESMSGRGCSDGPGRPSRSRSPARALAAADLAAVAAKPAGGAIFDNLVEQAHHDERMFERRTFEIFRDHVAQHRNDMIRDTNSWRNASAFRDARNVQAEVDRACQDCPTSEDRERVVQAGGDLADNLRAVREIFRARAKEALQRGARSDLGAPAVFEPELP